MTKLTLPVGKTERHNIEVATSIFKGTKVHVDGKPVSAFTMPGRLKMAKLLVGEKALHEVEVRIHGLVLHKVEALVDGKYSGQG